MTDPSPFQSGTATPISEVSTESETMTPGKFILNHFLPTSTKAHKSEREFLKYLDRSYSGLSAWPSEDEIEEFSFSTTVANEDKSAEEQQSNKEGLVSFRQGVLFPSSPIKSWREYYASIKDGKLILTEGKEGRLILTIDLTQSYISRLTEDNLDSFDIIDHNGQMYSFRAEKKAHKWAEEIISEKAHLDAKIKESVTFDSPKHGFQEGILKMGWVKSKVSDSHWTWKYLILSEYELHVYDKAPRNTQEIKSSTYSFTLSECNLKELEQESKEHAHVILLISQDLTMFVCTESRAELTNWINRIKLATLKAIIKIKEVKFSVKYNDKSSILSIDRENGLFIQDELAISFPSIRQTWVFDDMVKIDADGRTELIELKTKESIRLSITLNLFLESSFLPKPQKNVQFDKC